MPHCLPGHPFEASTPTLPRIYVFCSLQHGLDPQKQRELAMILHVLSGFQALGSPKEHVGQFKEFVKLDLTRYMKGIVKVKVCYLIL
jgi:hypothetical protein